MQINNFLACTLWRSLQVEDPSCVNILGQTQRRWSGRDQAQLSSQHARTC